MSGASDLGAVFDQHVEAEFVVKDIDATMNTMVQRAVRLACAPADRGRGRRGRTAVL